MGYFHTELACLVFDGVDKLDPEEQEVLFTLLESSFSQNRDGSTCIQTFPNQNYKVQVGLSKCDSFKVARSKLIGDRASFHAIQLRSVQ